MVSRSIRFVLVVVSVTFLVLTAIPSALGQGVRPENTLTAEESSSNSTRIELSVPSNAFVEGVSPSPQATRGIDWYHLFLSSFNFLAVEHAFRCATEQGTRDGFSGPFFKDYLDAAGNLHGWADGDPFLVNYIGHPMEGAVSGFIWQHNDRAYRSVVFGKNSRYWNAKLRGAAFAFLYSVQFEIGPVSEASLGNIQASYPQVGFVDHVITPSVGLGWTILEDSLDRYVIRTVEGHTANPYVRLLVRGGLNPSRSFANVLGGQVPWHRDDRPSIFRPYESLAFTAATTGNSATVQHHPPPGVAPFEFTLTPNLRQYVGGGSKGSCIGGGSSAALRAASDWQIVVDVNGCKLLGLESNLSGDSLSYMVGPRWTPRLSSRWAPHAQLLAGGNKVTQERLYPALEEQVLAGAKPTDNLNVLHEKYTRDYETNGFALAAGLGVDYKVSNAIALRLGNFDYVRSWTSPLNQISYQHTLQFTSGLVIRMGTW
jgi:hypothetical protein